MDGPADVPARNPITGIAFCWARRVRAEINAPPRTNNQFAPPHSITSSQRAGGVWEPGSRRWLVDRRRIVPVIRARITLGIPGRLHRNPQMAMNWFDVPDGVTATVSRPAARSAGPPDHHARSHRHLALTATSARRGSGRRCRWRGRRSLLGKGAAAWKARRRPKLSLRSPRHHDGAAQPSTLRKTEREPAVTAPPPANDDRKPAIVTAKRRRSRFGDVPDMTLEEHRWRGDVADAMFREMVRRAAGKD